MTPSPDDLRTYELSLLNDLLEGCQIISFDWRYLYLNDAALEHARATRQDLLGKTMMEAYPGIETTPMFATLQKVMEGRQARRMHNEFTYPDGGQGWFELNIQPCIEGILIFSQDITASKLADQSTKQELKRLATLRQIDLTILSNTDLAVISDVVLEHVITSLQVDAAMILLFDPHTLTLHKHQARGFNSYSVKDFDLKMGEGVAGRVALDRKIATVARLAHEARFTRKAMAAREGFEAYFGAPLLARGEVLGVLELFQRSEKPVDSAWMNFFEIVAGQVAIAIDHVKTLGELQRNNLELLLAYDHTIEGWARNLELRDIETQGHCQRVTDLTGRLAVKLGYRDAELVAIRRGALLHDIGKLGIPDSILFKEGSLTEEEWALMHQHPQIAADLLGQISFLKQSVAIPLCHHEKWDGGGYPQGLKGEAIPEVARMFAVVDVWDALSSDRPYRARWPREKILAHIREQAGTHFDPRIVDVFLDLVEE